MENCTKLENGRAYEVFLSSKEIAKQFRKNTWEPYLQGCKVILCSEGSKCEYGGPEIFDANNKDSLVYLCKLSLPPIKKLKQFANQPSL
jgi:hypothetical protein